MLRFLCFSLLATYSLSSIAAPGYIDPEPMAQQIKTAVGEVDSSSPTQVPIITWGGELVSIFANGNSLTTQENSLMAQAGLNIKLVKQDVFQEQVKDYMSGRSPYLRCTIGMCNQALDIINADPRTRPVIIHQLTWSRGGDTLVAKGKAMQVKDLKGKTIAVQAYGPHVDFMTTVLEQAGLSTNDVTLKWLPELTQHPDSPPQALTEPDIDAAFMIIPDAYPITSGRRVGTGEKDSIAGARMIISTMFARRIIADVYMVRSDYLEQYPQEVKKFVGALTRAGQQVPKLMKDLSSDEKMQLVSAAGDILLGDKEAIPDIEEMFYDAQFVTVEDNINFLQNADYPHNADVLNKRVQQSFNELGLISTQADIQKAQWNYSEL
ncbi:ABC transporter substrate-binding protein [Bacterioplanoides sp. SCSIO 12839]|uniref:ABC transporter substrate-binding protein n=1 Tax=Bacterioplanoides sp. SCSIO 12839 TaxID=2829569 RepID=UPI0021085817|nr:ABC transporter substrate-binding protein [Bacterioplanoides sp. SCSIO 12839]UTW47717.1 ABC transporter substrate-binding protein [Bacterioplanoides sp. SCSIO 12839]